MPLIEAGDIRIHYSLTGAVAAPVVIFSNSLGTNLSMWDAQAAALERQFRVLRYDTRGHGKTSVTPGPYTMAQLGQDVVNLLDALDIDRVRFCGLSMGGMIGQWLGIFAGKRAERLILCSTGAKIGTGEVWNTRIENVRRNGLKAMAPAVVERWLTPDFRARHPEVVAKTLGMLEASPVDGYVACCEAIRDADLREQITGIRAPTLIISGAKDPATPPSDGRFLAERIPGARYVELDSSHLSNVECASQFTAELIKFLSH
jgi:3-oxoadipate enol-lactonase